MELFKLLVLRILISLVEFVPFSFTGCQFYLILLKAQLLLYVPLGLTFRNSSLCPHSVLNIFSIVLTTHSHYLPILRITAGLSEVSVFLVK